MGCELASVLEFTHIHSFPQIGVSFSRCLSPANVMISLVNFHTFSGAR